MITNGSLINYYNTDNYVFSCLCAPLNYWTSSLTQIMYKVSKLSSF